MNEQAPISTNISFKEFLFKDKRNKRLLFFSAIVIVIQFSIFKYLYPYASYIHGDSFSYLDAAVNNLDISTYPIGYSKFLRLFSVFNRTDYILVTFQYLFIHCSSLYLLFTIFYFYRPGRIIQLVLLSFMILNPLFLHLGNLVSSDGLFAGLSLTWFALLLWIIHKPTNQIIVWHTIVLFIAFTVRYNALMYPFIALLTFALSKMSLRRKLIGATAVLVFCGSFVGFTMYKYKKLTGYWQYSPFSGWQFANNAMYAYRYIDSSDRKPVPNKFKLLDSMICQYFDSTRNLEKNPIERVRAGTYYMWSPGLSLYKYRNQLFKKDTGATELKKWASMGPFYKAYGLYIIKQYPIQYAQYFLGPNASKYYAPPIEFLEMYNSGNSTVTSQAKDWFGYRNLKVKTRMKDNKVWILDFFPILSGIINVVMLCSLLCYTILNGWQSNDILKKGILLGSIFWILNAGFTIFASSAALRFQTFPIILTTIVSLLLIDWMLQLIASLKPDKGNLTQLDNNSVEEVMA